MAGKRDCELEVALAGESWGEYAGVTGMIAGGMTGLLLTPFTTGVGGGLGLADGITRGHPISGLINGLDHAPVLTISASAAIGAMAGAMTGITLEKGATFVGCHLSNAIGKDEVGELPAPKAPTTSGPRQHAPEMPVRKQYKI